MERHALQSAGQPSARTGMRISGSPGAGSKVKVSDFVAGSWDTEAFLKEHFARSAAARRAKRSMSRAPATVAISKANANRNIDFSLFGDDHEVPRPDGDRLPVPDGGASQQVGPGGGRIFERLRLAREVQVVVNELAAGVPSVADFHRLRQFLVRAGEAGAGQRVAKDFPLERVRYDGRLI